jgi:hypothetical protein
MRRTSRGPRFWLPSFDPHGWPWEATERWVRFYSHPDGGQNPTTPAEYEEVVGRVTTIIDETWSDEDEIMLVTANVAGPGPSPPRRAVAPNCRSGVFIECSLVGSSIQCQCDPL